LTNNKKYYVNLFLGLNCQENDIIMTEGAKIRGHKYDPEN